MGLMPLGCFESKAFDYKLSSSVGSCWCPFLVVFSSWIFCTYIKYFKKEENPRSLCSNIPALETFQKGIFNDLFYVSYFKGPFPTQTSLIPRMPYPKSQILGSNKPRECRRILCDPGKSRAGSHPGKCWKSSAHPYTLQI